jgi:hypothetical protein
LAVSGETVLMDPSEAIPRFIACADRDPLCGFAWACNSPDVAGVGSIAGRAAVI